MNYLKGAEPFEFQGGAEGVLLLHGFTGSTNEVRYLGERLHQDGGYTVHGPCLPGHGTRPEDLATVHWRDWYDAASAALDRLLARCEAVSVAGLSMGGITAARLAALRGGDVRTLIAMAPAFYVRGVPIGWARRLLELPLVTRLWMSYGKAAGPDIHDPETKRTHVCYDGAPSVALRELFEYIEVVRDEVDRIEVPTLILHGARDHAVPPKASYFLADRIRSRDVTVKFFAHSFHVLPIDVDRDDVAREARAFLDRHHS
ncbi:MAG: alpha/beta fold hydrolase [Myxococcales bacterium]|nr:alpha/beta fold hydrolase [Myxococcales bacterium]